MDGVAEGMSRPKSRLLGELTPGFESGSFTAPPAARARPLAKASNESESVLARTRGVKQKLSAGKTHRNDRLGHF
jgi:hypothetical protein